MNELRGAQERANAPVEKAVVETKAPVTERETVPTSKDGNEAGPVETRSDENRQKDGVLSQKPSVKDHLDSKATELPVPLADKPLAAQGAQLAKEAGQVPKVVKGEKSDGAETRAALKDLARKMEKASAEQTEKSKKIFDPTPAQVAVLAVAAQPMVKAMEGSGKASLANKENPSAVRDVASKKDAKEAAATNKVAEKAKASDVPVLNPTAKAEVKGKDEGGKVETTAEKNKKAKAVADPGNGQPQHLAQADVAKPVESPVADKSQSKPEGVKIEKVDLLGMPTTKATNGNAPVREAAVVTLPRAADFLQTVTAQVRFAAVEGRDVLTVKLQPENLGKMTITLGREESGLLTGKLTVETEAVKQMLEAQLSDLKDHLEYGGIVFENLTVDVKENLAGDRQDHEDKNPSSRWLDEKPDPTENFKWVDLRYSDRAVNLLA